MKGFFEHQYLSFKKKHLSNLIALARIDDDLHDAEIDFFYKVGRKYGLKDKHITRLLNEPEESTPPEIPESHEEKISQLFDLAGMVLADGVIEKVELAHCNSIAKMFGFRPEIIARLIDYTQKYQYPQDDWADFVEEAKQYQL